MRHKRKQVGVPFNLRLSPKVIEKLGWLATEQGLERAEYVRTLLTHATRGAKPPADTKTLEVLATAKERAAWDKYAATRGQSLEHMITDILNKITRQNPVEVPEPPRGIETL